MGLMWGKEEMHRDWASVRRTRRACKQNLAVERHGCTRGEKADLFRGSREQDHVGRVGQLDK